MKQRWTSLMLAMLLVPAAAAAQSASSDDERTQYPWYLSNGYFGLSLGAMSTPLDLTQLRPGFTAASVDTPPAAFQVVLFGREFGKYFAAETNYTRPVQWASYQNINRTGENHTVWVVLGEFKLRARVPVTPRVSFYGDVGIAVTSRHGAALESGATAVESAHYPALLFGGGIDYRLNDRWSFLAGVSRASASRTFDQPASVLVSTGVRYHLHPLPDARARAEAAPRAGYIFPENVLQVGYAASIAGTDANHFFSHTVPIFWQGNLAVDHGFTIRYERNVFHSEKRFAFDLGVSVARWHAIKSEEHLASASVYPLFRFILLRTDSADLHVYYSLSGPTWLSELALNGEAISTNRFSFQDLFGVGVFAGKARRVLIGLGLGHYSNGNLFPVNAGVAIPLTLSLGYTF